MVRVLHKRKRSGFTNTTKFKRRRFNRSRARKTSNYTSQSASGRGIYFKKRKFRPQVIRRQLWNSSMTDKHYRSNGSVTSSVTTPASTATMGASLFSARRFAGNAFWTTAGGAINPDGGAIPTFATDTDFTIRGGTLGIRISNNPDTLDSDKQSINVTVFLIWTTKGFSSANVPSVVNVGWDPTLIQDFQTNIGKIVLRRNFLLRDGDTMNIERRMPIQKIDQTEYGRIISEPTWLITFGGTGLSSGQILFVNTYYNMSFAGDVV